MPAPFVPSSATHSPRWISKLTSNSTCTGPYEKSSVHASAARAYARLVGRACGAPPVPRAAPRRRARGRGGCSARRSSAAALPMMLVGITEDETAPRTPIALVKKSARMPPPKPPMNTTYMTPIATPRPRSRYGHTACSTGVTIANAHAVSTACGMPQITNQHDAVRRDLQRREQRRRQDQQRRRARAPSPGPCGTCGRSTRPTG